MLDDDDLLDLGVKPPKDEVLVPKTEKPQPKPKAPASTPTVNTGVPADTVVSMSALTYKSLARNSASVRAVQTRLLELGHLGAGSDLPGWLSDGTLEALEEFKSQVKAKGDSALSRGVVEALFKGLSVKVVD
jgi:hypothetical protein